MKVIEEIRRQRAIVGTAHAANVILSHSAFKRLLAEKDEFVLHQLNTHTILQICKTRAAVSHATK